MKQDNKSTLTGQRLEVPERNVEPRLPWRPFPVAALPEPLRTLVRETAQAIGCDPSMIALPALAVCASVIGTTRRVRFKKSWAEACVLWCAVVARSGSIKSAPLDHALAALQRSQSEEFKAYAERLEAYKREKLEYDAALAEWRRNKKDRGEPPEEPEEPTAVRHIVTDCTVEAIAPILASNPRGLLLSRDELSGWLAGFNQYKAGKGGDVASWLEMHRAGPVTVDRKTGVRIIHVPRAAVSVCGTIQPDTLRRQLTPEFFDCGLAARLLLAMPPISKKRWTEADISDRTHKRFADMIGRLLALQHGSDCNGEPVPRDIALLPDAKRLWVAWVNESGDRWADAADDHMAAAIAKIEGYAGRLALVCQLVRDPHSNAVDAETMQAGIALARWFAHEAERVYATWKETPEERERRELVELIERKGGVVTPRVLMRSSRRFLAAEDAELALNELVRAGDGLWEDIGSGDQGGRPTRRFRLADTADVDTTTEFPEENEVVSTSTAASDREVIEL